MSTLIRETYTKRNQMKEEKKLSRCANNWQKVVTVFAIAFDMLKSFAIRELIQKH